MSEKKEQEAFDRFANRLKAQAEREGQYRTDRDIRKETESLAHRAEKELREQKKKD